MSPVLDWIRSRGTTRWMPLEARTLNWPAGVDELLRLVGPHAGRVDDLLGADADLPAGLQVDEDRADDALALADELLDRVRLAMSAP